MPRGKATVTEEINLITHQVERTGMSQCYQPYDFSEKYGELEDAELRAWKFILNTRKHFEVEFGYREPTRDDQFAAHANSVGWDLESIMCSFYGLCTRWTFLDDTNRIKVFYTTRYGAAAARKVFARHLVGISQQISFQDGQRFPTLLYGCGEQEMKTPEAYVHIPKTEPGQSSRGTGGTNQ